MNFPTTNQAKTPLDVAKHLDEIVAFIELPDRIVAETEKVDGNLLTAINTSARLGVIGQRRKIEPTRGFLAALEKMTVTANIFQTPKEPRIPPFPAP